MRITRHLAALALVGALVLSGCSTASESEPGPTTVREGYDIPPAVDVDEWRDVSGATVMSITPAFAYRTIEELAAASDVIIVGRAIDQGPFYDHDAIATNTVIEVIEALKGTVGASETLNLYTVGSPVYITEHFDVDGAGDPPLFEVDYIFFLTQMPELTDAEGNLTPRERVWQSTGFGQYVRNDEGGFSWDGDSVGGSGPTSTTTIDVVRSVIADIAVVRP